MTDPDFVLPLSERYLCAIHKGVLRTPVELDCGHNCCKACILNATECSICRGPIKQPIVASQKIEAEINTALCYCKYGMSNKQDPPCNTICTFANLPLHEASCPHKKEEAKKEEDSDFFIIESSKINEAPTESTEAPMTPNHQVVLTACPNKDHGCFFIAENNHELNSHLNDDCAFERLERRIREHETTIHFMTRNLRLRERDVEERDAEIEALRLRIQTLERSSITNSAAEIAKSVQEGSKEILDDLMKALGEVPQQLNTAKDNIVHSDAFQKSSTAISSLKTKIVNSQITTEDFHPLDKLISTLQSIKNELVTSVQHAMERRESSNDEDKEEDEEETEELDENEKEAIKASLASFEEEERTRKLEDAAFEEATLLSLGQQKENKL